MTEFTSIRRFYNYGDALVTRSALEAGGFFVHTHSAMQAQMDIFRAIAYGGFELWVLSDEVGNAEDWLAWLKETAKPDAAIAVKPKRNFLYTLLIAPFALMTG